MRSFLLFASAILLPYSSIMSDPAPLIKDMETIMHQPRYEHATWGIYVKDLETRKILYNLNGDKLFSPASTSKLFSVAALLNSFGDEYRFKTPVYALGEIKDGVLLGNLVLVAQGDLTFGGRQNSGGDKIAFTKLDHINANEVPGVSLTKEDPLSGIADLAKQIYNKGVRQIEGDIVIDDSLFETTNKRDMTLSPILINENLIDIVVNPTTVDHKAELNWRPQTPGYEVDNQVKTVAKGGELALEVSADVSGRQIVIKGTIPEGQHDVVRTSPIKDPKAFARSAFMQALRQHGIKVNPNNKKYTQDIAADNYKDLQPVALLTSPPLSEYGKLILKVSHNLGADLIPLLLAARQGKRTFDDGMLIIGDFIKNEVKLPDNTFVMGDAAGGNDNRFTPQAEIQLLEYMYGKPADQFKNYFNALPILGVDGSLEDFAKKTSAAGKVHAKPGTGVGMNLATGKLFLTTQAFGGYIEAQNGHLLAYMVVVNNAYLNSIDDVFQVFEDEGQLSSIIYNK